MVRQAQVEAAREIPNVYVLPSTDIALYDFIHNAAQGNLVVGERCARCCLAVLYGKPLEWRAPEATLAKLTAPDTVELFFSRIYNWLNPFDVEPGLLPFEAEDEGGLQKCASYECKTESLVLHFARPLGSGARLHGIWRMNPGPCTPCDCMRMPMLSFYGLPITR